MKKVLFLCTGNTCRSPMAEALFNALCQERSLPFSARSAGLYAQEGSPASDGAYHAMRDRRLSLSRHAAQPLTRTLLGEASLVMAMTPQHAALCKERFPDLAIPIRAFDPPIPDPFGGSLKAYQATLAAMEPQLEALLEELSREP